MNYLQCPVCGCLYYEIPLDDAKKQAREQSQYFKTILKEVEHDYNGSTRPIYQFLYCHLCGTESEDFYPMFDPDVNPWISIRPIVMKK